MTDQEKKGFKWPWDYFHFQTKGRGSIFANGVKGKFMANTYFAEWLVFWFALLMTAFVSVIAGALGGTLTAGWYFATLGVGFVVSFIVAWFFFVFIIGPLTMSMVQYDFRADFRNSTSKELMFSKKSGKFWIWGILVDTMIVAPITLVVPFFTGMIVDGDTAAVSWADAVVVGTFFRNYAVAWVLAIIIIIFLLWFLKAQLGPNKKFLERMKAQGPPK
ncbi:MAG: hypothetical protein KGD64_03950 [Candidatus Heimdallarchaeota archaeon]|nr:hypothetical protein [Candidatus Heimdallarchaeota archaeon]